MPAHRTLFQRISPIAALVLGGIAFAPAIVDMVDRWRTSTDYYQHGPLVPLVCAWIVWRERERLRRIPRRTSAVGLALVVASVLFLIASMLEGFHFFPKVAFFGALLGTVLVFFGGAVARAVWFAFAFLWFMIPLPGIVVANLTFEMKMLAAKLAVGAMDAAGVTVLLDGSTIHMTGTSVTVDDVCSGLRTLIALLAIAAIFAYLERNRWRALLMVALAAPVAIAANVARILILCYLASIGSSAAHEGPLHEATGLATYSVALGLLFAIRSLPIGRDAPEAPAHAEPAQTAPVHLPPSKLRLAVLLATLGLGAAASLVLTERAPEETHRTREIPAEIGNWTGADVPIRDRVYQIMETRDIIIREYRRPGLAAPVLLYVVHAADRRKVAHPPEMCFTGGGYDGRETSVVNLRTPGREIPANRLLLDRGQASLLVYFWYRIDGRETASYVSYQISALSLRLRREKREASMIRLSTPVVADGVAGAEARVAAFLGEAFPKAMAPIP